MSDLVDYVEEPIDEVAIASQRKEFLDMLYQMSKDKASVMLRFRGPGVEGVTASARVLAIESSLQEILVENLNTPTGVLPTARVSLDDVLYVRLC
mmetsp:Transcript_4272/g.11044  ORF Transcript_4272/g.11044 Transcript_4272/m.11044 type:complete len:95 (+) Transcript_4272:299-583(+)